ncbi:MAG: ABC transporter permease [Brevefilum sp.]|nr:ABC transporter permease [Brevefilum sp.]MDT8382489.1 ABC transporter permease [Brevefilum sp.]MDW7753714.1 ABC transporter permease [Brevefilum sp.]
MGSVAESVSPNIQKKKARTFDTLKRVLKYSGVRLLSLFITVVVGVYLTILIANMGGYVDQMMKAEIQERITMQVGRSDAYKNMDPATRNELAQEMIQNEIERLNLDQPMLLRSVRFLRNALTLNLGRAMNMTSDSGSRNVRAIILERIPYTLLLMGTANFILFFTTLFLALALSRHYGSLWDKIIIGMSPTSSAPSWLYGIFLILIFAAVLKILPFGGVIDAPVPKDFLGRSLSVLRHLILPASSLIISQFFYSIYNWRTFFLIYSSEDYVEMAKAKGLPSRDIERRYILRPTLPTIITAFALLLIGTWTGAIITETVFQWPGLGRVTFRAIGLYDTPVIVGTTIIYAYLLAITVFLLDIVYALVDPRVKIGGGGEPKK